jgi:hypothetical protein
MRMKWTHNVAYWDATNIWHEFVFMIILCDSLSSRDDIVKTMQIIGMETSFILFLPPKLYTTQHDAPNMRNEICGPGDLKNELHEQQQQQKYRSNFVHQGINVL